MYSYCTDDQIKEFYLEFGGTEESVDRDVKYLIEWLEKQPHLPSIKGTHSANAEESGLYILTFNVSCKILSKLIK
ncbi:hypothetical protein V9T40_001100 [Parthenolecanium corni]|uniref:Uncharacterized protein n=1 Tax=Parthenolecanium corni TaxID=536013 RepID=A0AAN9TRP0_9HEMI